MALERLKKSCFIVDTRCLDSLVYRLPHFLMKTLEANTPKVSIRSAAHGSLWTGPRSPGFPAPELTLSICNLIVFLWVSVLKIIQMSPLVFSGVSNQYQYQSAGFMPDPALFTCS